MADSRFWKMRQAEFLTYAVRFGDVWARWYAPNYDWQLLRGRPPAGLKAPQEVEQIFNAIAHKAISLLPMLESEGNAEPWKSWLNLMRQRKWGGFRHVDSPIACTEMEWDAGVRDGKSLNQVRREQQHSTGEEWKKIYRRTKGGKLRRLSARELKGKNSDDLRKYFHWLQNGRVEHVFQASADFCEVLSVEGVESKTRRRRQNQKLVSKSQRREYRAEVRAWMKDNELKTIAQAAERLSVGYDLLKNMMTTKGKKRYGDETLKVVLNKIGCSVP